MGRSEILRSRLPRRSRERRINLPEDLDLLGWEHVVAVLVEEPLPRTPDDRGERVVHEHEAPLVVLDEDRVGDRVDDTIEEVPRRSQFALGRSTRCVLSLPLLPRREDGGDRAADPLEQTDIPAE